MKTYVKPELFYENFQLSHTIATCSLKATYNSGDCTISGLIAIEGLFWGDSTCQLNAASDIQSYCYQNANNTAGPMYS